jgi:hypothetical protein
MQKLPLLEREFCFIQKRGYCSFIIPKCNQHLRYCDLHHQHLIQDIQEHHKSSMAGLRFFQVEMTRSLFSASFAKHALERLPGCLVSNALILLGLNRDTPATPGRGDRRLRCLYGTLVLFIQACKFIVEWFEFSASPVARGVGWRFDCRTRFYEPFSTACD